MEALQGNRMRKREKLLDKKVDYHDWGLGWEEKALMGQETGGENSTQRAQEGHSRGISYRKLPCRPFCFPKEKTGWRWDGKVLRNRV